MLEPGHGIREVGPVGGDHGPGLHDAGYPVGIAHLLEEREGLGSPVLRPVEAQQVEVEPRGRGEGDSTGHTGRSGFAQRQLDQLAGDGVVLGAGGQHRHRRQDLPPRPAKNAA